MGWFKKHKILTAILVLIILVIIGAASSSEDEAQKTADDAQSAVDTTAQTGNDAAETKETTEAKIGTAVRDGKFEFTVNKVSCGETSIGDEFLNAKAQGEYCRINVSVKNIGNEAQTLSHSDQYAYNAQDQKYSADSEAAIYASNETWYENINPGNTVKGDIFFDVPKGTKLVLMELHDSAFSGGVKVNLK